MHTFLRHIIRSINVLYIQVHRCFPSCLSQGPGVDVCDTPLTKRIKSSIEPSGFGSGMPGMPELAECAAVALSPASQKIAAECAAVALCQERVLEQVLAIQKFDESVTRLHALRERQLTVLGQAAAAKQQEVKMAEAEKDVFCNKIAVLEQEVLAHRAACNDFEGASGQIHAASVTDRSLQEAILRQRQNELVAAQKLNTRHKELSLMLAAHVRM